MGRPEQPLPTPASPRAHLGTAVRECRRALALDQNDLAQLVGWSSTTLSQVESGKQVPSESLAIALDQVLNANGLIITLYEDVLHEKRRKKLRESRTSNTTSAIEVAGDASDWIGDVTVPDGSLFAPGEAFVKTWRIRNGGSVPWIGRYLLRIGAPAGFGILATPVLSLMPDTLPGQEVDVSVSCKPSCTRAPASRPSRCPTETTTSSFPTTATASG